MEDWVKEFKQFEQGSPFIKNLVFNDSKKGLQFVIMEWTTKIHDSFWLKLGSKKNNVRLAGEEKLRKLFIERGSTSIFNVFNDSEKEISNLVFDKKLESYSHWAFHPQDFCCSLEVKKDDLLDLLSKYKIDYKF